MKSPGTPRTVGRRRNAAPRGRALDLAVHAIDQRLLSGDAANLPPPASGWIFMIRTALRMSAARLAQRMGVSQATVSALEESERRRTIRLESLARVAEAMNCRVVYALVPNEPLGEMVDNERRRIAAAQVSAVSKHMALEDQSVTDEEIRAKLLEAAVARVKDRELWAK